MVLSYTFHLFVEVLTVFTHSSLVVSEHLYGIILHSLLSELVISVSLRFFSEFYHDFLFGTYSCFFILLHSLCFYAVYETANSSFQEWPHIGDEFCLLTMH